MDERFCKEIECQLSRMGTDERRRADLPFLSMVQHVRAFGQASGKFPGQRLGRPARSHAGAVAAAAARAGSRRCRQPNPPLLRRHGARAPMGGPGPVTP